MLDYLQKFNQLPLEVKNKISNQQTVEIISSLEKEYGLDLVSLVIKVVIRDIAINELENYLINNLGLTREKAVNLVEELKQKVFVNIENYLYPNYKDQKVEIKDKQFLPQERKSSFFPKRKRTVKLVSGQKDLDATGTFQPDKINEFKEKEVEKKESQRGSFFSPEEEKEIKELSKKTEAIKNLKPEDDSEEKINQVIKEIDIKFSSEATQERFKKILSTYLKGIRNELRTKQTLAKDYGSGGLNLDQATCDRIINIAQKFKAGNPEKSVSKVDPDLKSKQDESDQALKQTKPTVESKKEEKEAISGLDTDLSSDQEKVDSTQEREEKGQVKKESENKAEKFDLAKLPNRDIDYDLSNILKKKFDKEKDENKQVPEEKIKETSDQENKFKAEEKQEGLEVSADETRKTQEDQVKNKQSFSKDELGSNSSEDNEVNQEEKAEIKRSRFKIRRSESEQSSGKRIEDIKTSPKLTNPVNEIKYMDLTSFRRLGETASARTKRIKEKIDGLGDKYFAEKMDGIKAWRQNPINRMYLQIGRDSIIYNKSVDDIIKEKLEENKDYLNKEEFEAVMELNNKLRLY